jgi:hypothetical protein
MTNILHDAKTGREWPVVSMDEASRRARRYGLVDWIYLPPGTTLPTIAEGKRA